MKTITGMALATIVCATGLNLGAIAAEDPAPTPPKEEAKVPPKQTGDGNAARSTPEHAECQKYKLDPIVGARRADKDGMYGAVMGRGILNGPGLAADFCDCDDMDVDDAGNVYWTESGAFNILRKWDRQTNLVTTLAGSVCGHLDGPAESARFGSWGGGGYSGSNLQVSADGKHAFLADDEGLRHVDLAKSTVTTLGKFLAAKEKNGEIYVISRDGADVPAGAGYKPLKTPKLAFVPKITSGTGFWASLDLDKSRLYAHGRGVIYYWDLKTGEPKTITWPDWSKPGGRETDTSGPLETTNFQCPIGLSVSSGGRFLYVGGGDSSSFWRLDLDKKYVLIFSRDAGGICSFQEGKEFSKTTSFCKWPSVGRFSPDGSAAWSSPAGIFRLTPVK